MKLLHIIVYVVVLFILVTGAISVIRANANSSSAVITEDSPGWDCRTMGNHICGPKEYSTPTFKYWDAAFNCFAEIDYTEPTLSWNARVSRCIPDSPSP